MRDILLIKRIFDILCALIGLVLLFPVFVLIALLITINSPGSVFFLQTRVGQFGHQFKIYKFRTMVVNAENIGPKITIGNDPRITNG